MSEIFSKIYFFLYKHKGKVLPTLAVLMLIFYGLFWLAFGLVLLFGVYGSGLQLLKRIRIIWLRKISKGLLLVVLFFTISIGLKLLVFDIYRISSDSMEYTLLPSDVILVNKLAYGPRLPSSPYEIPWISLLFYMNDQTGKTVSAEWWPYRRLSGIEKLAASDVVIFKLNRKFFVIKRCVAVAGDTIGIEKGEVYVNGKHYKPPVTVRNRYRFRVKDRQKFYEKLDSLGIVNLMHDDLDFPEYVQGTLSERDREKIEKIPTVIKTERELDIFDSKKNIFAVPRGVEWTLDNIGPIIVSKKGIQITLNKFMFDVYYRTLEKHEGVFLEERQEGYFNQKGRQILSYTFKQDYYFVMGDNRKASIDSRYFGFVPNRDIVGKVGCILFSNAGGKFQSGRVFKTTTTFKKD